MKLINKQKNQYRFHHIMIRASRKPHIIKPNGVLRSLAGTIDLGTC